MPYPYSEELCKKLDDFMRGLPTDQREMYLGDKAYWEPIKGYIEILESRDLITFFKNAEMVKGKVTLKSFIDGGGFTRERNNSILQSRKKSELEDSTLELNKIQRRYYWLKILAVIWISVDTFFSICFDNGTIAMLYRLIS